MLIVPDGRRCALRYAGRDDGRPAGPRPRGAWHSLEPSSWHCAARRRAKARRPRGVRSRRGCTASSSGRARAAVVLAAALAALRLLPQPSHDAEAAPLYERASRAYSGAAVGGRRRAGAPRRRAAAARRPAAARAALRAGRVAARGGAPARGGARLRAGRRGRRAHQAQALFSGARAREAAGDVPGAEAWRRELRARHAGTPWAERLERESPASVAHAEIEPRPGAVRWRLRRTHEHCISGYAGASRSTLSGRSPSC